MFPPFSPVKGNGFSGFPQKMARDGGLSSIVYAKSLPDNNYLPADGRSVKAADYPVLARAYKNLLPYHSKRLTAPATVPTASSGLMWAISPDGQYAAYAGGPNSNQVPIYKLTSDAIVYLQSISLPGGATATPGTTEAMAFSHNGEYLACASTVAPFLNVYRRTAGTDVFTALTLTGTPVSATPSAIEFTDDLVLLAAYSNAGFGYAGTWQIAGSTVTRQAGNFPGALTSEIRRIRRSNDGKRWMVNLASSPFVAVYTYSGGVFSVMAGPPVPYAQMDASAISANGEFIALAPTSLSSSQRYVIEIWRSVSGGAYVPFKALGPYGANPTNLTFSPDDTQFISSSGPAASQVVYQTAGGSFLEQARGDLGGNSPNILGRRVSRDGRYMATENLSIWGLGPSPVDLPLPACPTHGSGDSILYPFVKVK